MKTYKCACGHLAYKIPGRGWLCHCNNPIQINSMHPLFQAILRPYTPPPNPSPKAIDRAMLADKMADGYNQRNIERAIKLEQQNARTLHF